MQKVNTNNMAGRNINKATEEQTKATAQQVKNVFLVVVEEENIMIKFIFLGVMI